jgi:RNA polymerase sigma-70 factor, ECF subfamily
VSITSERPESSESGQLLSRARAGDEDAYCQLACEHEETLFRQAVALCRNPANAEDLTSETLVEAWKSLKRFDGSCRFSTWLYAILVHRFQKSVRAARSRPVPLSSLPATDAERTGGALVLLPDTQPLPADKLLEIERAARLRDAIDRLPPKHQQVILLRFYEQASLAEIAAALKLSTGTVKSRLHHALGKLRNMKSVVNLLQSIGDTCM